MLDKKTFLQGINYLKAIYINWNFDINNDLALKIWYKKFSDLDNEIYVSLIEKYTNLNKFPPNSPQEILNLINNNYVDGNEAFNWIIKLNMQYPVNNEFQCSKFYQELKKDNIAYELFEELEMKNYFNEKLKDNKNIIIECKKDLFIGGFGRNYIKDKFIKWYNYRITPTNILGINKNNNDDLYIEI